MIRHAHTGDLTAILDIYNSHIQGGTASFEVDTYTLDDLQDWFKHHQEPHAIFVYVAEDTQEVLGYASLSPYGRPREKAYHITAEISIYVSKEATGRGIGSKLMHSLIQYSQEARQLETLLSTITKGNASSIALHEKFGFTFKGELNQIARKFDQTLDVVFYTLDISSK